MSINNTFLEGILGYEKCIALNSEEKESIRRAYRLAQEAHIDDKQLSDTPYMNHIDGVIDSYLQVTKKSKVSHDDLCTVILHDVIEDHPEFSEKVFKMFGGAIYRRVLGVTKPSALVIQETFGVLTRSVLTDPNNFGNYKMFPYLIGKFSNSGQGIITHYKLHVRLIELWDNAYLSNEKGLKNYKFLWMIADLSEEDFEIKAADRFDNLNNLKAVGIDQVRSNIVSTEVYILKARALGREDLVILLEQGLENLKRRKQELQGSTSI